MSVLGDNASFFGGKLVVPCVVSEAIHEPGLIVASVGFTIKFWGVVGVHAGGLIRLLSPKFALYVIALFKIFLDIRACVIILSTFASVLLILFSGDARRRRR